MGKHHYSRFLAIAAMLLAALSIGCDDATGGLGGDAWYSVTEITASTPTPDVIDDPEDTVQDDDSSFSYDLPWTFTFYGTEYTDAGGSTNGFITFGTESSDYDIDLADYGDPVIAAWNADLDSESYGEGTRVQSFSDPDRVVYDFDLETHDQADEDILNHFQIVLFQTGEIVFHFIDFASDVDCYDEGSGISIGDNTEYINLTTLFGVDMCTLGGRSFQFTPIQ